MDRKSFLSVLPGLAALSGYRPSEEGSLTQLPPFLKAGDIIGFTSPAGYISLDEVDPSRKLLNSWGYEVRIGDSIGRRDCTFGGTDEMRLVDLQQMMDDPKIACIMCARGGYGVNRILDQLDLTGITIRYSAIPDSNNRFGESEGILVGGNLAIITSMMGTASEINTNGAILFVEEVGEYLYSIDRMFSTLHRSGKLSKLKGLIIGGFNRIKAEDPGDEFGRDLYDIVLSKAGGYGYPICFGFPVGHQKNNYAIMHGRKHKLIISATETILLQQ